MPYSVLVIEDNLTLRQMYTRALRRKGIYAIDAKNKRQALSRMDIWTFDAAVCDIKLGNDLALDLIEEMKSLGLSVLAISAEERYRLASLYCGASAFLTKPMPMSLFVPTVETLLKTATTHRHTPPRTHNDAIMVLT